MRRPTVINVVSGKGGTGKTLLSAVLAEMLGNAGHDTLVVDLDIFVRGLTSLLYFHKQEALHLIDPTEACVADYLVRERRRMMPPKALLGFRRYRSFDVLPSVRRINERLDFRDLVPDNRDEAEHILRILLSAIGEKYRFVLLDSRAGYDELIAATHMVSDVTVCVEEDDDISRVTADNLMDQLQRDADTPLFRITNKARDVARDREMEGRRGVAHLGAIPFDIDVMNSFGARTFWEDIARSLYQISLARVWNRLDIKLQLAAPLPVDRPRALPSEGLERRLAMLGMSDRVIFVYGIITALLGLGYALLDEATLYMLAKQPIRLIAASIGIAGILLVGFVVTRAGKRWGA